MFLMEIRADELRNRYFALLQHNHLWCVAEQKTGKLSNMWIPMLFLPTGIESDGQKRRLAE